MPNLLTQEHRRRIKREYLYRVLTTVFILVFVTGVLSSVFLLPSYLLAKSKVQRAEDDVTFLQNVINQRESGGTTDEARKARERLERISNVLGKDEPTTIISNLVSTIPEGISVTSIQSEDKIGEDGSIAELRILGSAADRESLLEFTKFIEREDVFGNVDLPVSSLAEKTDISFSLVIDVYRNNKWQRER